MKMSETNLEELLARTPTEKWELICGDVVDDGAVAPVALLLGTKPIKAISRAKAAAELYRAGRVQYVVPSGGVKWEYEGEQISEAELMTRVLLENGVPREAIILENEARTTKENMIYGTLQINRALSFTKIDRVIIVTCAEHMKRSVALAKAFLPRKAKIFSYAAYPDMPVAQWLASEEHVQLIDHEIKMLHGLVQCKLVEDCEIDADPILT